MNEQVAIQNLLRQKLLEIQTKNTKYSLRAYADKLGVNPGALSYVMNGKRNVSLKLAERIVEKLMLDPQQRSEMIQLFPAKRKYLKTSEAPVASPRYLELKVTQFKIAAEWEHFAIMSLYNCHVLRSTLRRRK